MDDFMDMAKKAQAIAGAINSTEEGNNQGVDMDQLLKAMEMAKALQSIMPETNENKAPPKEDKTVNQKEAIHYFDDDLVSPEIKSLKSAIPYLEYRYQRVLAVMVKLIETKNVIEKFSQENYAIQQNEGGNWQKDMLSAIRPHMNSEKQQIIDMIHTFLDLNEIAHKINNFRGETYGI